MCVNLCMLICEYSWQFMCVCLNVLVLCGCVCKCNVGACLLGKQNPVGSLALGDLPPRPYDITPSSGSFQKVLFAASSWSGVTGVPARGRQAAGPSAVRDGVS